MVKGMTNKEIAQSLTISVKTVETHRARVMEKMRAESLAGLCAAIQAASSPLDIGVLPASAPCLTRISLGIPGR